MATAETIAIPRADGGTFEAHLVLPERKPAPAIIVAAAWD